MSKKTAKDMRWHKEKCIEDKNVMHDSAESKDWKHFDEKFSWFAVDC